MTGKETKVELGYSNFIHFFSISTHIYIIPLEYSDYYVFQVHKVKFLYMCSQNPKSSFVPIKITFIFYPSIYSYGLNYRYPEISK